jgi:hypothetical protein
MLQNQPHPALSTMERVQISLLHCGEGFGDEVCAETTFDVRNKALKRYYKGEKTHGEIEIAGASGNARLAGSV